MWPAGLWGGFTRWRRGAGRQQRVIYQAGRLAAYGVLGAVAGATGRAPLEAVFGRSGEVFPWFLVAVFVLVGIGFHHSVPFPGILAPVGQGKPVHNSPGYRSGMAPSRRDSRPRSCPAGRSTR